MVCLLPEGSQSRDDIDFMNSNKNLQRTVDHSYITQNVKGAYFI